MLGRKKGHSEFVIYLSAFFAALGGFLFGYNSGVISGAILYAKDDFNLSILSQEFVVAALQVGAIIGACIAWVLADLIGRKKAIIISAFFLIVGTLFLIFAPEYEWLVAGRAIVGFGIGISSMTVPLYIAEVAPPNVRGACVTLNQLAITFGILISYIIDYSLSGLQAWRWMFGIGIIPSILLFILMFRLYETPRWLIKNKKEDEAQKVLEKLRRPYDIQGEIEDVKDSIILQKGDLAVFLKKESIKLFLWG